MDTWYIYAYVDLPYDDDNPRASANIEKYLDYAEREEFDLVYRKYTRNEDGIEVVRLFLTQDTYIPVTGDLIEGGESDEILFEPDEPDDDPNDWVKPLITMGADLVDAFFDFRRGRLKPLPNPLKGVST